MFFNKMDMNSETADYRVAIECCPDYYDGLLPALKKALRPFGGMEHLVRPGQKVLLKPNLLRRARPEEAVVTHPLFVGAVAELVRDAGGRVIIADSPGAALPYTRNTLLKLYRACGLDRVAEEPGVELSLDTRHEIVPCPEGKTVKRIELIRPALKADLIINLPKFKTHSFTILTGAVKNFFGLVPGLIKPSYHAKFPDVNDFSSMLVDLMELASPAFTIVDGILAMEGDGPGAGEPRSTGLLVAGRSSAAVDVILSRIMSIDPLTIATTRQCRERGLLPKDFSEIEVLGEELGSVIQEDFRVPMGRERAFPGWALPLMPIAKYLLSTRPRINRVDCVGCGDCVRVCPVKAVRLKNGTARIDYRGCIRCYCCHETCSHHAISLVRPLLQRLLV